MVKKIKLSHLIGLLSIQRGARFATITALTDARLLKTGNPNPDAKKRSVVNVVINWHYANSVNRQREREGTEADFVPQPRKWGQRIKKEPFVTHNGSVYLECKVERSISHEYLTSDGRPLTQEQVNAFIPEKKSNAVHQGVEREIIVRDYAMENIEAIRIDGSDYAVDIASIPDELRIISESLAKAA